MARKRRLGVADCETDPFAVGRLPRPFVWGYYDETVGFLSWWGEDCTDQFAAWLAEQDACVYGHNAGRFDWHYLTGWFEQGTRPLLINGRVAKIRLGKAELRDSWCVAPVPLSSIGDKLSIDYRKMERAVREEHRQEIMKYLTADCVELHSYLKRFEAEHGRVLTIASAAMRSWKALNDGEMPKTSERYYNAMLPWYAGGRVEAREAGTLAGPFALVDINSAYPRAMMERHPYGGEMEVERAEAELYPFDPKVRRFYRLTARHEGALWARTDSGGLSFAPGEGEYHVTDWELDAGLQTGTIDVLDVHEVLTFERTRSFEAYVDTWFAAKRDAGAAGDSVGRLIAKLFLNSLYGKFGANPGKYREYLLDEIGWAAIDDPMGDWVPGPEMGEVQVYSRPLPPGQRRYYDVATAASVTGYVRAVMWRAIAASERVVYCDTDSLVGSGLGVDLGPELGQWEVEVERITSISIGGKKLYAAFDGSRCVKQANKGVRLPPEAIVAIAEGASVVYESESPTYSFGRDPVFTRRTVRATV